MDLPVKVVRKWQKIWHDLCEMSYNKGERVSSILIEFSKEEYDIFVNAYNTNPSEFDKICLERIWKRYDRVEPKIVKELNSMYVPRILFETIGAYTWFAYSFPECKLKFWEEDM